MNYHRPAFFLALTIVAALAAGCASSYSTLVSEDSVPDLAPLKKATLAHANHTTLVPTTGAPDAAGPAKPQVRIAVHELECAHPTRVIVMLHGLMADNSAWRFIAGDLAADHGLMLIDLPGCGLSDVVDPDALGPGAYSVPDQAERVLQALRPRLARLEGGPPVTLVGHSLGGAIAIRMLSDPALRDRYGDVISRVDSSVLLAPLDVCTHREDPLFRKVAYITPLEIDIAQALGILRDDVATGQRAVSLNPDRALREETDKRLSFLTDPARRRAMQATLRSAIPWNNHRPDWDRIEAATALYSNIDKPMLIVWGMRDEMLPISMGFKLATQIPGATLLQLPGVMHSPHMECPVRCAQIIREFAATQTTPLAVGGAGPHSPGLSMSGPAPAK